MRELARTRVGVRSHRLLTMDAKSTPPNWPMPSFSSQLSVAASGTAPLPRPAGSVRVSGRVVK